MQEIIFNSGDEDFLKSEAARLGFMDDAGNIIINGTFESGGGWFLAIVGKVYEPMTPPADPEGPWPEPVARPGYWGRLRINGTPDQMPEFGPELTQYVWNTDLGGWTNDGETLAPEWVSTIGMIA